jgi:Family of unknown function (DUF5677)
MTDLAEVTIEHLVGRHREMLQVVQEMTAHLEADAAIPRTLYHIANSLTGLFEPLDQLALGARSQELAWRTRGIFELSLIAAFVCSNDANRQRFETDAELDELDIFERLTGKDARGANFKKDVRIEQRRSELQYQKRSRPAAAERKPMQAADFALAVNRKDEYDDVYKLYSKLAHPTAWAILAGSKTPVSWDGVVRLLLLNAHGHVANCVLSLITQIKISTSSKP